MTDSPTLPSSLTKLSSKLGDEWVFNLKKPQQNDHPVFAFKIFTALKINVPGILEINCPFLKSRMFFHISN